MLRHMTKGQVYCQYCLDCGKRVTTRPTGEIEIDNITDEDNKEYMFAYLPELLE